LPPASLLADGHYVLLLVFVPNLGGRLVNRYQMLVRVG